MKKAILCGFAFAASVIIGVLVGRMIVYIIESVDRQGIVAMVVIPITAMAAVCYYCGRRHEREIRKRALRIEPIAPKKNFDRYA
jgi:VIT1/CCC1 family predicted Fe2+/Mn2+ transporter